MSSHIVPGPTPNRPVESLTTPSLPFVTTPDLPPDGLPAEPVSDDTSDGPTEARTPNWAVGLIVIGLLILGLQAGIGWALIQRTVQLAEDLAAATADAQRLAIRLDGIESDIATLGSDLADLGATDDVSIVDAPTAATGLPRYPSSGPDPALGLTIPELGGDDYYTGAATRIGVADGKATITMIWAHWCPYCQQEVPMLAEVVESGALDAYDAVVLQTVTTFIDESRPNPLVPYLEDLQLPYPVVVDHDGSIAAALGMGAVPAWVVTDEDGAVLGRFTGSIGRDAFLSVVEEVQGLATEGQR